MKKISEKMKDQVNEKQLKYLEFVHRETSFKYLFVASATLASRSAIAGGMDAERAYNNHHLHESIRIKDLAGQTQLNGSYLSTLFKKETGYTPKEYRNTFFRNTSFHAEP
ncbi:MAG: AraC family transcriptional regulator [Lachnospiraceae bacterium]|nr:AraC family transcriptional regulator [Lachnospiraceae bacterium]